MITVRWPLIPWRKGCLRPLFCLSPSLALLQHPFICKLMPLPQELVLFCNITGMSLSTLSLLCPWPDCWSGTVPINPTYQHTQVLRQLHDSLASGHLGANKMFSRGCEVGYWVNMIADVDVYCCECLACQAAKPPAPQAPLTIVLIGKPWQMVGVDVLNVLQSPKNNHYLLVVQDHFTTWVETIPFAWPKYITDHQWTGQELHYTWIPRDSSFRPRPGIWKLHSQANPWPFDTGNYPYFLWSKPA